MRLPLRGRFLGTSRPAFVPALPAEAAEALVRPLVMQGIKLSHLPPPRDSVAAQATNKGDLLRLCNQLQDSCRHPSNDGEAAAWLLLEIARTLQSLRQPDLAVAYYELASQATSSRDLAAWAMHAVALRQGDLGNHGARLHAAKRGLEARPDSPELLHIAAHASTWVQDPNGALALGEQSARHGCFKGGRALPAQAAFMWTNAWWEGACDVMAFAYRQLHKTAEAKAAEADCAAAAAQRQASQQRALVTGLQAVALAQRPEDRKVGQLPAALPAALLPLHQCAVLCGWPAHLHLMTHDQHSYPRLCRTPPLPALIVPRRNATPQ